MAPPRRTKRSNALFDRVTDSASWDETDAVEALLIAAASAPSLIESLENRVQWARAFLKLEPSPDSELLNAAGHVHNEILAADTDGLPHRLIAAEVLLRTLPTLADLRERTYDTGAIDRALRAGMAWAAFVVMAREHVAARGEKFKSNGRGRGPIRKLIDKELANLGDMTPIEAWAWLADLPARRRQGFDFTESTRNGSATKKGYPPVAFKTFSNQLSMARTKNKADA